MSELIYANGLLRLYIEQTETAQFFISRVEWLSPGGWQLVVLGEDGREFSTSIGNANAATCAVTGDEDHGWLLTLTGAGVGWSAREELHLLPGQAALKRTHTYTFDTDCQASIAPGWRMTYSDDMRYTYALRAHEQPLAGLTAMRSDIAWALPFPFHVWHTEKWIAMYGLDKRHSVGTLDFVPRSEENEVRLNIYYPESTEQPTGFGELPRVPSVSKIAAGKVITLHDVLIVCGLQEDTEPLLEAERCAAGLLLDSMPERDMVKVADGIAAYLDRCELWEADAFGAGKGWFRNMWVYTQAGTPKKQGSASGYYDLGWGEGIAVEIFLAVVRHWNRTGDTQLLRYVDEMTRNMHLFKRGTGDDQPYFDRSDGKRFGDFGLDYMPPGRLIWTHSLAHVGSQLIQAYQESGNSPYLEARSEWLSAANSIGRFLRKHQQPNGDLQDIFDDDDNEVNKKPHRILARAAACGLWARLSEVTGDPEYIKCAQRLVHVITPEINAYAYYNQMIDTLGSADIEFMDGEAAYYVLEGLASLYAITRNVAVLALCRKAAAFGIAWTYFFDLPYGNNGVTRGGQCCRMPDYPLLYPIGPAKAIEPLLNLHKATDDPFYRQMAYEMTQFIAAYQWDCPGKPWHGGMIHAIDQATGKHWGPDKCGQVDTGMASANSLAALEAWLRFEVDKAQ